MTSHPHKYVFDLDANVVLPNRGKLGNEQRAKALRMLGEDDLPLHLATVLGDCEHFIFPGFYALFRWLHSCGHEIHFFSSAVKPRNAELVPILLERAFGVKRAQTMLPAVKIASRPDLFDAEIALRNANHMPENQGLSREEIKAKIMPPLHGNMKKRMTGVLCTPEELPDTLLLEDDSSYMAKGEEYNIVVTRGSDYSIGDEYAQLNRSCFYAGLIQRIETWCKEQDKPLVEGAKYWQFTNRNLVLDKNFFYRTCDDKSYYAEGFEILRRFEPKLQLYPEKF